MCTYHPIEEDEVKVLLALELAHQILNLRWRQGRRRHVVVAH